MVLIDMATIDLVRVAFVAALAWLWIYLAKDTRNMFPPLPTEDLPNPLYDWENDQRDAIVGSEAVIIISHIDPPEGSVRFYGPRTFWINSVTQRHWKVLNLEGRWEEVGIISPDVDPSDYRSLIYATPENSLTVVSTGIFAGVSSALENMSSGNINPDTLDGIDQRAIDMLDWHGNRLGCSQEEGSWNRLIERVTEMRLERLSQTTTALEEELEEIDIWGRGVGPGSGAVRRVRISRTRAQPQQMIRNTTNSGEPVVRPGTFDDKPRAVDYNLDE